MPRTAADLWADAPVPLCEYKKMKKILACPLLHQQNYFKWQRVREEVTACRSKAAYSERADCSAEKNLFITSSHKFNWQDQELVYTNEKTTKKYSQFAAAPSWHLWTEGGQRRKSSTAVSGYSNDSLKKMYKRV